MKYLITGCSGFVGHYLIDHILACESNAEVVGVDMTAGTGKAFPLRFLFRELNLMDSEAVTALIAEVRPDFLVHLASYSSVSYSWQRPVDSFMNNTNIFLNLLDAVREYARACRILSIGSSEEYGIVTEADTPLSEEQPLHPASPYAAARVAQEHLSLVYAAGFGMDVVCTRSFNHAGAGQSEVFVISSIARKFAEFKAGKRSSIPVGDTDIIRDFLDVRDVVRAYYLLLKKGESGEVYNVCSGKGLSIGQIITILTQLTATTPPIEVDKSLLRPVENRVVVGSYDKLQALTGWRPAIDLKDTLVAILQHWKKLI